MGLFKKKKKEFVPGEPGTFKYFYQNKSMNPVDIYKERLEYLKFKRKQKEENKDGKSK